jgi:integrase
MFPGVFRTRAKGRWYYYAWRGGPSLPDPEVDPPAFQKAFARATAKGTPAADTIALLISDYRKSPRWLSLSDETRRVRAFRLTAIETKFSTLPLSTFTAENAAKLRGLFIGWQEGMAATPRAADDHIEALNVLLGWGLDRGRVAVNPARGIFRLYSSNRSDVIFTDAEIAAVLKAARPDLRRIVRAALLTGLRAGDLAELRWDDVDLTDGLIERVTNKSRQKPVKTFVVILPAMRAVLAEAAHDRPAAFPHHVFLRGTRPWRSKQISDAFDYIVGKLGVEKHFHDLRGNAATALMAAGMDPADVDEWMGWRPGKGKGMRKRYVDRRTVAKAMADKLAGRTVS